MKRKIVTTLTVCGLLFINTIPALGAYNKAIVLPANQSWVTAGSETRTKNYSYVKAGCDTVYPASGKDNFRKIQVRLRNGNNTVVSLYSYEVLTEGTGLQQIEMKQGYLATSPVTFQFRGNSSSGANAIVDYIGL